MVGFRMRHAFTPVEIVIVIALIGIVAAILYPVVGFAREKTRQSICMSNQRQLAMALIQYAQDNNNMLPATVGNIDEGTCWHNAAARVLNSEALFSCPSIMLDGSVAHPCYGLNGYLCSTDISTFALPAKVVLTADAHSNFLLSSDDLEMLRHNGSYVISFADGHTATLTPLSGRIVFGEGEEGDYLAYGSSSIPIVFDADDSAHFAATGVGSSAITVDEGVCVQLVNPAASPDYLTPRVTANGAQFQPRQGAAAAIKNWRISAGKRQVFTLYCEQDAAFQKVETTYQFGEGQHAVSVIVRKSAEPTSPPAGTSGSAQANTVPSSPTPPPAGASGSSQPNMVPPPPPHPMPRPADKPQLPAQKGDGQPSTNEGF